MNKRRIQNRAKGGQTLVEYALIMVFIAVAAIAMLSALGSSIKGTFTSTNTQLNTAKTGGPVYSR